jgi:hypothetical protein
MCAQPTAAPDDGGVSIILSPVQLAAVLENQTVSDTETRTNRLWGTVTLIGGAIELVGAAALLLTPEPTTVTKIAGGALAVHGSDTVSTGLRQIWTGRPQSTVTAETAAAACRSLGCDPDTAGKVGTAVDIMVPVAAAAAVGAARLIAVRAGTIDLWAEEAAGGHTIEKHVAKTEADLRLRLVQEPKIPAASSFRNLAEAEPVREPSAAEQRVGSPDLGQHGASRRYLPLRLSGWPFGRLWCRAGNGEDAADDGDQGCSSEDGARQQDLFRPHRLRGAVRSWPWTCTSKRFPISITSSARICIRIGSSSATPSKRSSPAS